MDIYVVQEGDTINSIALKFNVSTIRIIQENGLTYPNDLVVGETIVITYPLQSYTVKDGDTLSGIATSFDIPIMQLYQNNPFLWDRDFIFPGDILVISYKKSRAIKTNAYAFPFINQGILRKTLPYLTYLSILNYKTLKGGDIESYYDDSELIQTVKQFGVMPILLLSSINFRGERNPQIVYDILLTPEYQIRHAQRMVEILKEKGYLGVNITITHLNDTTNKYYLEYLRRVTSILKKEKYLVFITVDPNFEMEDSKVEFNQVDYSKFIEVVDEIYIMQFFWGTQYKPPMPVSSIQSIKEYLDFIKGRMDISKINIGFPLLGYDWTLPYIEGVSLANAITLDSAINLARVMEATILFDEISKTPYFSYSIAADGRIEEHIVWFVDARTIYEISTLVKEYGLKGAGVWSIMSYYPQLWLIFNSTYETIKLLPYDFTKK